QTGIGSDTGSNTVVSVDAAAKAAASLPFSKFVDDGTLVTYSYSATVATSPASDKRYRLSNTPGTSVLVNAAQTITGNYVTQCQVTFAQTGIGGDSSGTVLTYHVNSGSNVTKTAAQLPVTITVNAGDTVTYTYSSPVAAGTNKRYALTTPLPSPASPITVSSSLTVTGTYKTQYQVSDRKSDILNYSPMTTA